MRGNEGKSYSLPIADVASRPVYKILPEEFAVQLATRGGIRVGTLQEFRTKYEGDKARADEFDGVVTKQMTEDINDHSPPEVREFAENFFKFNAKGCSVSGFNLRVSYPSPDCYLYCLTHRPHPQLVEEFGGTVVEISDLNAFARVLQGAPQIRMEMAVGVVTYTDDPIDFRKPVEMPAAALRKPWKFGYQNEVRLLYRPTVETIAPLVFELPALADQCRLVSRSDLQRIWCQ